MTELEKMERAKMYIDKLANGINPIDNMVIPDGDAVNNVRLSRCFFYVSDVLRQVIDNGGVVSAKRMKKVPFAITFEKIQKYEFSDEAIALSKIADRINELIDTNTMKKISYRNIAGWLVEIGMLEVLTKTDGKTSKVPTEMGKNIGISTELRIGQYGNYEIVVYNHTAQQFIIDNIDAIIENIKKQKEKSIFDKEKET